jgi:Protein of unknown function (DUF998)
VTRQRLTLAARGRWLQLVATLGLLVFVGAVVAEHALVPGLSPLTHEVSEYANTRYGAPMVAGFLAWALSLAATVPLTFHTPRRGRATAALTGLLAIASVGLLLTACFHTQTSAGHLPAGVSASTAGELHNLASGVATIAFWLAAPVSLLAIPGRSYRTLTLALILLAAATTIVLLAVGPSVAGLRQRCLLAVACTWQLVLLRSLPEPRL